MTRRHKHLRRLSSFRLAGMLYRGIDLYGLADSPPDRRFKPITTGERTFILSLLQERERRADRRRERA